MLFTSGAGPSKLFSVFFFSNMEKPVQTQASIQHNTFLKSGDGTNFAEWARASGAGLIPYKKYIKIHKTI